MSSRRKILGGSNAHKTVPVLLVVIGGQLRMVNRFKKRKMKFTGDCEVIESKARNGPLVGN
jgi:hypothetical protein